MDGMFSGFGVFIGEGMIREGEFKDGKPHGKLTEYNTNTGRITNVLYQDGELLKSQDITTEDNAFYRDEQANTALSINWEDYISCECYSCTKRHNSGGSSESGICEI